MTGRTHAIVGANTVWIPFLLGYPMEYAFLMLFAGTIGGLLPDLDAPRALIHKISKGFFQACKYVSHHRGFFHSIVGVVAVSIPLFLLFYIEYPSIVLTATLGYITHCIIDGFTVGGVRYLFPLNRKFFLLPKPLRVHVGGILDHLLFSIGLFGIVFFILHYLA